MPLSTNISLYADVEAVLSRAREVGGGIYAPKQSPVRWVQRAYMYRKLLLESIQRDLPKGVHAHTPYDLMSLKIVDSKRKVSISFRKLDDLGTLTPFNEQKPERVKPTALPGDELFADVMSLVEEEEEK